MIVGHQLYHIADPAFDSSSVPYYNVTVHVTNDELKGLSKCLWIYITETPEPTHIDPHPVISVNEEIPVGTELYQVNM